MEGKTEITLDDVISYLNELVSLDRKAIEGVVEARVKCNNEALVNHPTCLVTRVSKDGKDLDIRVGFLGIINGVFGGEHRIAAQYDDHNNLIKFMHYNPSKDNTAMQ